MTLISIFQSLVGFIP